MIVIHKPTIDDYAAVRALVAQVHALHHAARGDVYAADAHFCRSIMPRCSAMQTPSPLPRMTAISLLALHPHS